MKSPEVRSKFLSFFEKNGHTIVSSSSLIPAEDPTLLFTNAGMNQFKDAFLGLEKRSYTRATSMQKCVRAGGKHNDLDQVGFTPRHLTFFEMMGNFSFGEYFKKEAIQFAWDFLTKDMGLPADKLHASVYQEDDESYDLWHNMIGLPKDRIVRCGEKDNFWAMGDTGPCGPCSEIHFDRGEQYGCGKPECGVNCDHCSRVMEVWNLVFMQYNRDEKGNLNPLAQTGVDTGMGFERLCTILQKKDSVYHCDVFTPLLEEIEKQTSISYTKSDEQVQGSFNVLADHVRSTSLIIADGGSPSNEGRGYVLRKIIRRGALFAQKLSDDPQLFSKVAQAFIKQMSRVYPELKTNESLIVKVLDSEIERFSANLIQGQGILEKYLATQKAANSTQLTGEQVFKLYDTYGFPPELTRVIASESNFDLDMDGYDKHMLQQQTQSGKKATQKQENLGIPTKITTQFVGYETTTNESKITFVKQDDEHVWIVTEQSPFYVESGGQVNDQGTVTVAKNVFKVVDLKKVGTGFGDKAIAVKLKPIKGADISLVKVGATALSQVNNQTRMDTVRNHTATHMLQAALQSVIGEHVKQAGSVVEPDYLRFDYTCPEALTPQQIQAVENLLNQKIQQNITTTVEHTSLEQAKSKGVIAFFGEKYNPENVRVVTIPGFSAELCGGTHAPSTGIIGAFKIVSDAALSTGTRRLVAVTGPKALKLFQDTFNTTKKLSEKFKVKLNGVLPAVEKLQENHQAALSQIKQLKKKLLVTNVPVWAEQIKSVGNVPFLYLQLEDASNDEMKNICEQLEKTKPGFYFLVSKKSPSSDAIGFMGYVSKDVSVNARDIANTLREKCGLKGGGSPTLIQGGGMLTPNLEQTVQSLI